MNLSWKDVAHYGVAGIAGLDAIVAAAGVQIPGVTIDPKITGAFAVATLFAGFKGGITSGTKTVIAFLAVALAVGASQAHAADLSTTKAATPTIPYTTCTQLNCSGFYGGADILESGGNFDVISTGLNGLAQNNLAMGAHIGYEFWNGQFFLAAETGGDYGVVQNGAIPGGGNSALWDAYGLAKVGYSLSALFGTASSSASVPTPTLPQALANALMSPYVILGAWDRPWGLGFASGAGVQALLAKQWTLSVDYIHVDYNNAAINPNVNEQTENIIRATLDYHL